MPELPEVETVRRGLDAVLKGATIEAVTLRRKDLRIPFPEGLEKTLAGRKILGVERRAKYLIFDLGADVLIAHLGMTGRFSVETALPNKLAAHDHMLWRLKDGRTVIFNDARRFGLVALAKKSALSSHPFFEHLGPEPFDKAFSPAYLKAALAKRKGPIKPVLMDQELMVGVGNIYASEALFLAKINPNRQSNEVSDKSKEIIDAVRKVLKAAIASGGSSLRDFVRVSGEAGYFQHQFQVYGRQNKPCYVCQNPIKITRHAGRSTFFCSECQK